ncbi:MAG: hypothetical protein P0107_03420 [Nitrosomonas sp.]|nr:hypothetical protein [Nitrosomonas sp.]
MICGMKAPWIPEWLTKNLWEHWTN